MTFEITNHCDHHLDAYVPYYRLKPSVDGPRMPNAFLCFLTALIPSRSATTRFRHGRRPSPAE